MTDSPRIPTEPARRAALRAALTPGNAPLTDTPDLDATNTGESGSFVVNDVCVQLTPQQAEAVTAVGNALHYAGALPVLLPERDRQKAFRAAVKAVKLARMAATRWTS